MTKSGPRRVGHFAKDSCFRGSIPSLRSARRSEVSPTTSQMIGPVEKCRTCRVAPSFHPYRKERRYDGTSLSQ